MTLPTNIFGIVGWRNSGKTTLIVELVGALRDAGYSVATIKHAHHAFDIDIPGKDSFRHREAGANQVIVSSKTRWAMISETTEAQEPSLSDLLGQLSPVDVVLVEGFKHERHPKLQVLFAGTSDDILDDDTIIALASDGTLDHARKPVMDISDISAITNLIAITIQLG